MKAKKYIERIVLYSNKILKYINDIILDEFILDNEKIDAILLNLQQIGQTAKKTIKRYKKIS